MKCKACGNKKEFTMVREIAFWNDEKKEFEDTTEDGDEFYVCNDCMIKACWVDPENDY